MGARDYSGLIPLAVLTSDTMPVPRARPAAPHPSSAPPSALERQFPNIARQIALLWGYREADTFFRSLWLDDRGTRQGFPVEVMSELMFLSTLHASAHPTPHQRYANRSAFEQ
jgi:hypothetical protein